MGTAKNSSYMKFANRQLMLNIIRKKPVSRAQLARETGLTRAAVTLIVNELLDDKIVLETGVGDAEYGRKPILLDINPERYYAVGVDISRHACNIGLVNLKGQVITSGRIDAGEYESANTAIGMIAEEINKTVESTGISNDKILGIGLTSPGPLDIYSGTILNPPNFELWRNVNIVKELEQRTNYRVLIRNISCARTIAEKNYGRGSDFDSFMLVVVDEGIGSGIIINNKLYQGVGGFGSEFGHTSICFNGKMCSCGNTGCLEAYASIPNILDEIFGDEAKSYDWSRVVDMALSGDESCIRAVEREAIYLSCGITNIINLLELQAVIIAGDINYKPDLLLARIREAVSGASITGSLNNVKILNSSITGNSRIISSASVMLDDFFRGAEI